MNLKDLGIFALKRAKNLAQPVQKYFAPTPQVRKRDFIREVPGATWKVAKQIPQDIARFGLSLYDMPKGTRTSGYHNIPLIGRINSFQDEARNRVMRGDPMWKAMGNPMLDTLLTGADVGSLMKVGAKSLKSAKFLPKEMQMWGRDLLQTHKNWVETAKSVKYDVFGKPQSIGGIEEQIIKNAPDRMFIEDVKQKARQLADQAGGQVYSQQELKPTFDFQSRLFKGLQKPGMNIDSVDFNKVKNQPTTPIKNIPETEKLPGVYQSNPETFPKADVPYNNTTNTDADLLQTLNKALKEAKPLRGQQEALYTQARAQKMAKMMSARGKMAGEKGFFAEKGALRGELPKIEYENIRQNFTQENVDRLFNMVKESKNLNDWDKIAAQEGLAKILGESGTGVPTRNEISKMHQVFGKEFTETLLSKRPAFERLKERAMQVYNLPRSMMAGMGDFSATLMQNALFAYRHPVMTAKNFGQSLKYFGSDKFFKASMQEIGQRQNYQLMKDAKISFTDVSPITSQREEEFMSSLAEKIPGIGKIVKASGRAYTGFLNKMRADVADQLIETKKLMGDKLDDRFLSSLGTFVNMGTGRGTLGKLEKSASVLSQGLFSARKLMATFNSLNPAFYIKADPLIRKEAIKTMLAFFAGASTITGLSKLAGADVVTDPTNSDFGKIKIGNTRINLFGTYQQLAVLMARQLKGYATSSTTGRRITLGEGYKPLTRPQLAARFFESKEHPTLSLITGKWEGQNTMGEKFDTATEFTRRMMPMLLSDAYDLYQEHGGKGLYGLIPAILGLPTQTYGSQIPNIEKTDAGNPTLKLKNVPDLSETIVNQIRGTQPSNIPQDKWGGLVEQKRREQDLDYQKEQIKKGQIDEVNLEDPVIRKYIQDTEKKKIKEQNIENIKNDIIDGKLQNIQSYPKGTLTEGMINELKNNGDIDFKTEYQLRSMVSNQEKTDKATYIKQLIDLHDPQTTKQLYEDGILNSTNVDNMFEMGLIDGKRAYQIQMFLLKKDVQYGKKQKPGARAIINFQRKLKLRYGQQQPQPNNQTPQSNGQPFFTR